MRQAGKITAAARNLAGKMVTAGTTTQEIDKAVHDFIISQGAIPTFLGYSGYPASICISVNDELIHGIPGNRVLRDGDVVSIDVGATKDGYVGDCAATYIVGGGTEEDKRLVEVTRQSFFEGMKYAREGYRVSDISHAIQSYVEENGFSVVREYVGHGVGSEMHESPEVPNYGKKGQGYKLVEGDTICIEPMSCLGKPANYIDKDDNWTVKMKDGSIGCHCEHTVLVTSDGYEVLTLADE